MAGGRVRQLAAIFVAILLVGVLLGTTTGGRVAARSVLVGGPAPDFVLPGTEGETLRLSDLRGHLVWVTFFSTWCTRCRAENPDIEAVYKEEQSAGRDLVVLAVGVAELPTTVRDYARKAGLTFPIGADIDRTVAPRYGVLTLPTHVFIDDGGAVRRFCVGALQPEAMRRLVAELAAPSASTNGPGC